MHFGLRHIRYFTAVAEELHFRRAAERVNIAQPALSRSIKHLEQQIGVKLLERNNRNVKLTHAGKVFLSSCHTIMDAMEGAVTQTRKANIGKVGHLIIGYTDFAISGNLPQILQDFREAYPEITIEPVHGFTHNQAEELKSEKIDFGFFTGPCNYSDISSINVQNDSYVAVLYENHPLAKKESVTLKELSMEPFILGSPEGWKNYLDHLLRVCGNAGFTPNIVQQAFNSEGIFGLIACEMGITIHSSTAHAYRRKGLVVKPIKNLNETFPTVAAWKNENISQVRQLFVEFLQKRMQSPNLY